MLRKALFIGLALAAPVLHAEDLPGEFSVRSELLLYRDSLQAWSGNHFESISPLPEHSLNAELRPDFDWTGERLTARLRPRLNVVEQEGASHVRSWLNEAWLRWRAADRLTLQGGREVLLWGPGAFWNPSNPFFSRNNKDKVKHELAGHDFLRARWQMDESITLSLIRQTGHEQALTPGGFGNALKLDWIGQEASGALILAEGPQRDPAPSGYLQWTASDALLLYAEAAFSEGDSLLRARVGGAAEGWQLERVKEGWRSNLLAGSAYTFESGWTLSTEYWRHGAGLGATDAAALAAASRNLAVSSSGSARRQLGQILQADGPLRRNYLGLQLTNGSDASTGWTLRYQRSLDDNSGEALLMVRHDLNDQLQLWGNLLQRHGGRESEFGRHARSSTVLGLSWFLF